MSAEFVDELHQGSSTVNKDGSITLTRVFRINTGDPSARPAWGIADIAISKWDAHPDDATCLATDVSSSPVPGELGWFDVTYTYSNRPFDSGTTDTTANGGDPGQTDPTVIADPTARTPTVSWSANSRMVPFTKDHDPGGAKAVNNSAGQPFEGLEREDITTVITITFNKAGAVNVTSKQNSYVNTVNLAAFTVLAGQAAYGAGKLRCNGWNGSYQYEAGYGWYTQCTVELEYKRDGWAIDVLDAGFYRKKASGSGYVKERILDTSSGMPADAPAKLNGSGGLLPDGDPDVYLTFYPYEQVAWTNILTG